MENSKKARRFLKVMDELKPLFDKAIPDLERHLNQVGTPLAQAFFLTFSSRLGI